jgi:Na+-translocating ferredoxin:NAD+ oxidoreductase subunit B
MSPLALALHAVLPQTQCTRCGYPDCASYASAVATNEAATNQCPPGGAEGIRRLDAVLGRMHDTSTINPANGVEGERQMAWIDEAWCIGCTLCIKACPTDAIVGANKRMHVVIEDHCTGCELCVPACPVDCIHLESATPGNTGWQAWDAPSAAKALSRFEARGLRTSASA